MGKQMLVYVIGMSMLMAFAILNLNKTSLSSQDSLSMYFGRTMAHNIAVAGANIGTQLCLSDTSYHTNLTAQPFNGGTYDVIIARIGDTTSITAYGHLPMRYYDYGDGAWRTEMNDTVISTLKKIYFSRYAYFSDDENFNYLPAGSNTVPNPPGITANVYKVTGDSIFGPAHTNGQWNFSGSPWFGAKITGSSTPNVSGTGPIYQGGSQWGISVNRPSSQLDVLEGTAGKIWTAAQTGSQDIGIQFINDGRVRLKIPWNTGATKDTTYGSITAVASNGIFGVKGIDMRVWGSYNGQATVFARTGTASLKGNLWIQGDLVAADDPETNPGSDDMLGLVAERMAYVTTTGITRNSSSQTNIDAAIYTQNGIFAVENYNTVPVSGRLNLYGGVVGKAANVIGTFSGSTILSGMVRSYRYDSRFLTRRPPGYPSSDKSQLISWWEGGAVGD